MSERTALVVIIALGAIIVLFLRELWCWYFKTNKIVDLLGRICKRLQETESRPAEDPEDIELISKTVEVCRKCGSFRLKNTRCPVCNCGWFGKKVNQDTWDALTGTAKEQGKSLNMVITEMATCVKCGTLTKIGRACPKCGSA